jgi:PBP1b-binding outer membrane lipoprotein LpoB
MKTIIVIAAMLLSGCTGLATIPDADDPPAIKATAIVVDTAVTWRIWELLGYVK